VYKRVAIEGGEVFQRVLLDDHEVRQLAGLHGADILVHLQRLAPFRVAA